MSYSKPIKRDRPLLPIRIPEPSVNRRPTFSIHKDPSPVNVKYTFPVRKDASNVNVKTLFPVRKDPPSFVDAKATFPVRKDSTSIDAKSVFPVRKGQKVIHELLRFSYVPLNKTVYTAAYSGCISGFVGSSRNLQDTQSADSQGFTQIAGAFAKSFDIEWGAGAPDTLQVFIIEDTCKAVWENRNGNVNPTSLNTTSFTRLCQAIIAIIEESEIYFDAQGIVPDAWPGGGGGSGTVTSVTAGSGISVTGSPTVNPTVNNTGVLDVTAGTGTSITGSAQHPTINNTGILALVPGPGIAISTVSGTSTISNTQNPLGPNASFAVSDWYVAPISGLDTNDGLSAGTPFKHYSAVVAKWGTLSPVNLSPTGVRIHFLEDFTDLNDPVDWSPIDPNSYGNTIVGTQQPIASGDVLAGVVPKNRPAGHGLSADLGEDATDFIGLLLTNITRSARSYVRSVNAGTVVNINQPLDIASDSAEVDTYANGDSFTITRPTHVNINQVIGINIETSWSTNGEFNSCGIADSRMDGCSFENGFITNCLITAGTGITSSEFIAGSVDSGLISGGGNVLTLDTALSNVNLFTENGGNNFSTIADYLLVEGVLNVSGTVLQGFSTNFGAFYGTTYIINVDGYNSTLGYGFGVNVNLGIALQAFLGTPLLEIQGQTIAASWNTNVSPQVYVRTRSLTPLQLDTTIALGGLSGWAEDNTLTTGSKFLGGGLRVF